jgi:hypothetical protein
MTLQIGQLITAYQKGYHRITAINDTGKYPCVEYKRAYNVDGVPKNGPKYQCHISFCKPVTQQEIDERIEKLRNIKL